MGEIGTCLLSLSRGAMRRDPSCKGIARLSSTGNNAAVPTQRCPTLYFLARVSGKAQVNVIYHQHCCVHFNNVLNLGVYFLPKAVPPGSQMNRNVPTNAGLLV